MFLFYIKVIFQIPALFFLHNLVLNPSVLCRGPISVDRAASRLAGPLCDSLSYSLVQHASAHCVI